MDKPKRYTTLEGMRGIGAIYVVLLHGEQLYGVTAPQSAYLGVDFFFVLSGFVVAHVYAAALDRGLSIPAFLQSRLLRLYPIYLLGTVSTIALAMQSMLIGHNMNLWTYTKPLISLPFAIALLPSPASDAMFPLDIPAWSLFLEFLVNIGFAFRLVRSRRVLAGAMALSALGLVVALATIGDLNVGWSKDTSVFGLARVCFSFPLGVLIYRFRDSLRVPSWFYLVPVIALAGLVYVNPSGPARIAFDIVFICGVSPALVLAGAAANPLNKTVERIFIRLGALSYPLYALHYPILMAVTGAISRHVPAGLLTNLAAAGVLVVLVAAACYVATLDARLRGYLGRRLRPAAIATAA